MSGNKGLIAFIFSLYMKKKISNMKTIETIKQMIADGQISQEVAEKYFPELKESEDERIRKELVDFIYDKTDTYELREKSNSWLAWLEKQAEQKSTLPKWKYKSDNTPLLRDSLILNEYGCVAKSPSGALVSDVWVIDYDELIKLPKEEFEKPGKQKETLCDKCKKAQPFHSCQDITALGRCAVEHEQKFYEGDWIACEELSTGKIIRLDGDRYEVEFIDGSKGFPHIDYVDRDFHLWTIQDAKDGDILYSIRVNAIILYKYRSSDDIHINAYCALQKGIFIKQEMLWDRDFVPATKEQRDLFFQKMKEAGHEWDAKKKELKKIEPKFEIGDLITNGILVGKIDEIHEWGYHAYFGDHYADVPDIENWHKWTIEDTKNGDVLSYRDGQWIFIYKEKIDDSSFYYHILYSTIHQDLTINDSAFTLLGDAIIPATKKQRYLLFQKMKEAGYEFDFGKKELKEIVQSSTEWSEEDERLFQIVIDVLDRQNHLGNISHTDLIACVRKLKSLRPKKQWKPSEEQMKGLRWVFEFCNTSHQTNVLKELYEQLKQL